MARDPGRLGCAAESVQRGEPLRATASRVTRWLLIEQPGPWGREALLESRLEPRVAQTLRSKARRLKVRVVLIRRPTRERTELRRAYLVRTQRSGSWAAGYEVASPEELEHLDLSVLDGATPSADGTPPGAAPAGACQARNRAGACLETRTSWSGPTRRAEIRSFARRRCGASFRWLGRSPCATAARRSNSTTWCRLHRSGC